MATFGSFAEFEHAIGEMFRDIDEKERRKITGKMGEQAQRIATTAASADLGGDPKFSGWRPELVTQVRHTPDGDTILTPTRFSAGPWTVADQGRNQMSGPKVRTGRDGRAKRTKRGNVSVVRRRSRWNGVTQGKSTATNAVGEMDRQLPPIAEREIKRVIRRRFDVS